MIAVTIAGSDSGGGAGIQADLKTFSALGVYGASVITALTAQNTRGVQAIHDVEPEFVARQIESVFTDLEVKALKIGMLSRSPTIAAVAEGLARHAAGLPLVLDPVMVATSGDRLLADDAVSALRAKLVPHAAVLTPNLPEAAVLLGEGIAETEAAMLDQGHAAACVLSSDIPTLPARLLVAAARHLLAPGDRAVLGASDDGGYYVLGLKAPHARMFADIAWSTDSVAAGHSARSTSA